MVELFITVLARIHRFLSLRVYYRRVENGNVRFHSLDGKWVGGTSYTMGSYDPEAREIVPHPDGPRLEAFIFGAKVPEGSRRESGFSNQEEAEAATRRLLRKYHGPYVVTERGFGT